MVWRSVKVVLLSDVCFLAGTACRKESEQIERGNRQITKGRDARTVTVGPSVDVCQPGAVLDQLLQHGGQERGGGRGQGTRQPDRCPDGGPRVGG